MDQQAKPTKSAKKPRRSSTADSEVSGGTTNTNGVAGSENGDLDTSNNVDGADEENNSTYEGEEDDDEFDAKSFLDEERTKLCTLIEAFGEEELRRYEAARRCSLNQKDVKLTMEIALGRNAKGIAEQIMSSLGLEVPSLDEKTIVAVNGLAKLYLRELIELACGIADERDQSGKIQPKHLREAYRRMKLAGRLPFGNSVPVLD